MVNIAIFNYLQYLMGMERMATLFLSYQKKVLVNYYKMILFKKLIFNNLFIMYLKKYNKKLMNFLKIKHKIVVQQQMQF